MSRSYTATAFRDWLEDECQRIANAFKALEHIQADYQGSYTRFRADHDKTLSALADELQGMSPDKLPRDLRDAVNARLPEEKSAIQERKAALDKEIPPLQKQADHILQESQKKIAELRILNPQLNEREERLKANLAALQAELDKLNRQVSERAHGIGFVLNALKIQELDRERYRVVGHMQTTATELHKVREEWKKKRTSVEQAQVELKKEWEDLQSRLGQLREERDDLQQNAEARAKYRAIRFVLDNDKTPTRSNDAALAEKIDRMVALNIQTDDFQSALGSVAGILGILKGVDEGLKRLGESVRAVINEQQRHTAYLSPLSLDLDDGVLAFGKVWDELAAKAKDEKAFAAHPADFVAAMKPFLDERLTKDKITGFFNSLGQALQRATGKWSRR